MIKTTNPLKRSAWAVFLQRGRLVCSYLLRNSNIGDKERMVELLARRYMTEPENIVVDIETTGLEPVRDCIMEISAVKYRKNRKTGKFLTGRKPKNLSGTTLSDCPYQGCMRYLEMHSQKDIL